MQSTNDDQLVHLAKDGLLTKVLPQCKKEDISRESNSIISLATFHRLHQGMLALAQIETMHAGLVPVLYMKMMSEFEAAKKELIKACKDPATTFIFSR